MAVSIVIHLYPYHVAIAINTIHLHPCDVPHSMDINGLFTIDAVEDIAGHKQFKNIDKVTD